MEYSKILFLTSFCVMACDGDMANEEINLLKNLANQQKLFGDIDVEDEINKYIRLIKDQGLGLIKSYLEALSSCKLTEEQELLLLQVVVKTIHADNNIEYSEIKFFKSIRNCLNISDEKILNNIEGIEDFWLEKDIVNKNIEDVLVGIDLTFSKIENV